MPVSCPICAATGPVALGARSEVPVILNRTYATAEAARAAPRGALQLKGCTTCGFVWNCDFDAALIAYDSDYENDQAYSSAFAAHLRTRAADVIAAIPDDRKIDYLEIGCGQGRFMLAIANAGGNRLASIEGFDPAWRGEDGAGPAGSRIHKVYFDSRTAQLLSRSPNAVVSRHTIEHVPNPIAFLTALRTALGHDARARIFIETPCVSWILKHEAMQDFFYEHCSLFTARTLSLTLRKAGFRSPHVHTVFGDQYLWAEAATDGPDEVHETEQPGDFDALTGGRARFVEHWRAKVSAAAASGPVALWGAGAKGVTFALMTDPENDLLDHVVDINPGKQNRHIAGSGLKVLSPKDAADREARTIFVMNSNYLNEIKSLAADAGLTARLVPIN
jgi:SAM-dependent methyltransferase